jgi:catechol 2,3-dioxygenase-like lactoylglutathione lyase family enzyme
MSADHAAGGARAFLYVHCSDLAAARRFYTNLLGLSEVYFSAADGTVGYRVGTLQISVAAHPDLSTHVDGWSRQLGWEGGASTAPSWGVEMDRRGFHRAVRAILGAGDVQTRFPEPQWVGYWSFPVRDPMGNTVEVSTPKSDSWSP